MLSSSQLSGVVLAGGLGRRLGRPKASLSFQGTSLVERAVNILDRYCTEVIVVSRPEVALPDLKVPIVMDEPGPPSALRGLVTGLANSSYPEAMVLACDLPFAAKLVSRIVTSEVPARDDWAVVGADQMGVLQPLCARYARIATLRTARELLTSSKLKLKWVLDTLNVRVVVAETNELINLNSLSDLEAAQSLEEGADNNSSSSSGYRNVPGR